MAPCQPFAALAQWGTYRIPVASNATLLVCPPSPLLKVARNVPFALRHCTVPVVPSITAAKTSPGANPAFETVTVTEADVVVLLAASRATAVRVWLLPLAAAVVSHEAEYGAVVSSAPRGAPSSRNWTPATPTLSEALAVTVTMPETVAPELGKGMLTVGGVVSFDTVTVTEADVVVLLAASRATALRVWVPSAAVVVSHGTEYGDVVSSAPRFPPSTWNWTPKTPPLS